MKNPLPEAVLSQHLIALGKTRSGKSSKLRLIVEGLLDEKKPAVILDPKGDWWGLKSSADGKRAGYPVIIFGGEHADVPINEHSGGAVAELVATGNRPAVIDLGGWMVGERTRFFIQFASHFFKLSKGRRWLVVDECHNFAPQGKVMDPDAGKALHWANRLASEGGGKGITLISASQRPQKVHKDYLTSHETIVACKVSHPLDRNAVKDWLDGCGDAQATKTILGDLAQLQRSEAYVWSPEAGFGPKRVTFPLFKTYDSFAPQDADTPAQLKGWAAIDLEDVKTKLAGAVEEAKANDPKELKRQLAAAQAKIASLEKGSGGPSMAESREMLGAAQTLGYEAGWSRGWVAGHKAGAFAQFDLFRSPPQAPTPDAPPAPPIKDSLGPLTAKLDPAIARKLNGSDVVPKSIVRQYQSGPGPTVAVEFGDRPPLGAEKKPLQALAAVYPAGMTEAQWAVAAGIKRTGGTWSTYKSRLTTAGRIERRPSGEFSITRAGLDDLGGDIPCMPAPGPELVEFWAGKIPAAGPMLKELARVYPNWVERAELGERLSITHTGGTFSTYLSRLRSPGLVEVQHGAVRASPSLMGG